MIKCAAALFLVAVFVPLPDRAEEEDYLPAPKYPRDEERAGEQGKLTVEVRFAADGSVADCRVIESDTTAEFGESTLAWIRNKWHSNSCAGKTEQVPIIYANTRNARLCEPIPPPAWQSAWYRELSSRRSEWTRDFVPPPFMRYSDEILTLSVTFDSSGHAAACSVIHPSGSPTYDSFAAAWAKRYWHHAAFAGTTAQLTVIFNLDPLQEEGFYVRRAD